MPLDTWICHDRSIFIRARVERSYLSWYERYRHTVSLSATSFSTRNSSESFLVHFPRWVTYLPDLSVRDRNKIARHVSGFLHHSFSYFSLVCPYLVIDTIKSRLQVKNFLILMDIQKCPDCTISIWKIVTIMLVLCELYVEFIIPALTYHPQIWIHTCMCVYNTI